MSKLGGVNARSEEVDVVVSSNARFASTVRIVAAAMAADAGFSVDEIDDFRLGLNEAFALYADGRSTRVRISFRTDDGRLQATVCDEVGGPPAELDVISRGILSSVVDEFEHGPTGIVLRKSAAELSRA